jgi:hypothetical protein
MKTQIFRHRRLLVIALVSILISLTAAASAWSSRTNIETNLPLQENRQLQVVNKTQGAEIISVQRLGGELQLELRNGSSKAITAYALSVEKSESVFSFYEDFIYGDKVIASGEVHLIKVPIPQSTFATDKGAEERLFSLQGVLFEDRSSDGDVTSVRSIEDARVGTREFLVQVLPLISIFVDSPEALNSSSYQSLLSKVSSLEISNSEKQSGDVKTGFNNTRESVLDRLGKIQLLTTAVSRRESLREFRDNRSTLLAKL